MYILDQDFLRQHLTMPVVIDNLKKVLYIKATSPDNIQSPERLVLETNRHTPHQSIGAHLSMPATLQIEAKEYTSIKLVTICPDNPKLGLPTTNASIVLSENSTGQTLAFMDATFITQIRTGALSGIATEKMAIRQANTVAIIGCGGMAYEQLNAVLTVRPSITTVYLWNRDTSKVKEFAQTFTQQYPDFTLEFVPCATIAEAVSNADIINLATRSEAGLFSLDQIKPNVHINAVGAYTPTMKEVGNDVIAQCQMIVVDDLLGCQVEAGDLIQAVADNNCAWDWDKLTGDLPSLVAGNIPQKSDKGGISLFKSVGTAYFDAGVALTAYELAQQKLTSQ